MKYYVYQLRASDEQDPFYIGKTFEGSRRMLEHRYNSKKNNRMVSTKIRSIQKRGCEVLKETISEFDCEKDALKEEIVLIFKYGRRDIGTGILCNHTIGGEGTVGHKVSVETRRKMSLAKMGNKINVGRKRLDNIVRHGKKVAMFSIDGQYITTFDSMGIAQKQTGVRKSCISLCCLGKIRKVELPNSSGFARFAFDDGTRQLPPVETGHSGKGEVIQLTRDQKFVARFKHSKAAQEATGINGSSICACAQGKSKSAGKYLWKFAKDIG